jgi:hypothetical protein
LRKDIKFAKVARPEALYLKIAGRVFRFQLLTKCVKAARTIVGELPALSSIRVGAVALFSPRIHVVAKLGRKGATKFAEASIISPTSVQNSHLI